MAERHEAMLTVSTFASVALHAVLVLPVIFDLDLFDYNLDEPPIVFAVGMVPLSELTAAPEIGEITPPRPLERLELPAGNEAREVETVDAEAPEQAPSAEAAPESASEPPPSEDVPTEAPPQVASADQPPPALSEAPEPPADQTTAPEPTPPPPSLTEPEVPEAPAPDATEVAALDAPSLPSTPQPEDRPADPALPAPPLPPDRTQARIRADPQPAEDEVDDDEPPVDADAPPAPEQLDEPPTELAALEPPPAPALTPRRERAPEPPTPPTTVVDNTAEPPDRPSAIETALATIADNTTAAASGQGSGSDAGSGGRSGSGTAQSGARLAGATLTLSEEEALRAQLRQCWNIPAGARDAANLQVTVRAVMNPDRTVQSAEIVDSQGLMGDDFYRAAAEAARRALFVCQPLALPADKYQDWAQITFNFDPRDMF